MIGASTAREMVDRMLVLTIDTELVSGAGVGQSADLWSGLL